MIDNDDEFLTKCWCCAFEKKFTFYSRPISRFVYIICILFWSIKCAQKLTLFTAGDGHLIIAYCNVSPAIDKFNVALFFLSLYHHHINHSNCNKMTYTHTDRERERER